MAQTLRIGSSQDQPDDRVRKLALVAPADADADLEPETQEIRVLVAYDDVLARADSRPCSRSRPTSR